ncbi:hypothetical protein PMAYCL1PPCAC_09034, partial [Pristionchus mayeri]
SQQDGAPCKVCNGPAAGTHFGVRACRACSAFFRRALSSSNQFECFKSCPNSKDCKKCRLDRCIAAGMIPTVNLQNKCSQMAGTSSISFDFPIHPEVSLLQRLSTNYKDLSRKRFLIEQEILRGMPDLLLSNASTSKNITCFANFDLVNSIWRATAQLSIKFLHDSFTECDSLGDQNQFALFQNFIFLLYLSEGYFKAAKRFEKRPLERFFTTCSTTLEFSKYDEYFAGTEMAHPSAHPQVKEKFIELESQCRDLVVPILDRMDLREPEFVALLVIAVWSAVSENCPELAQIGERYRERIFKELHTLYRDVYELDNYATRLGELMTLTNALQMCSSSKITELQFLNFFEVFTKKSFASSIVRKTKATEEPMF